MKDPKFKYGDLVLLIAGFYRGQKARVKAVTRKGLFKNRFEYMVLFDDNYLEGKWIKEERMELLK